MIRFVYRSCLVVAFLVYAISDAAAQTNIWTNAASSSWSEVTNWSAAQLPSTFFSFTVITNDGTKTVLIDSNSLPVNRSVRSLVISARSDSTNELLVQDISADAPFTTSGTLTIGTNGSLRVTNSTVKINGTFDVSGSLVLDSGLIDTAQNFIDVRVGRLAGATGNVVLNGGVLNCFGFGLGKLRYSPGQCTINGGILSAGYVVTIGDAFDAPSAMNVLAGEVRATNGITKVGNLSPGEWNQTGGNSYFSFLSIGDNAPGTMTVSGGKVTVTPRQVDDVTRVGNFGEARLDVSNAFVALKGEFHVADNPGVNGTVTLADAELTASNALVAIGRYGIGEMTVSNATAWFTNTSVGRHTDAIGRLNVQTGGRVYCLDDLSIGRFTNAFGYVVVSGGLISLKNDSVWVGREGVGELTVSDGKVEAENLYVGMAEWGTNAAPQGLFTLSGGSVSLSSNMVIGTAQMSTGTVVVAGGRLDVTNDAGNAFLDIVSGTLEQTGGIVQVDRLILTNAAGDYSLKSGTLRVGEATVANGRPFVVGDGVNPATLQLVGRGASFPNGLVIQPNATVAACGPVLGSVVNNGMMTSDCNGAVYIESLARTGSDVTVWFSSRSNATHVLEFKNAFTDSTWTQVLPGIIGDGGLATAADATATNAFRFYRIRVQ